MQTYSKRSKSSQKSLHALKGTGHKGCISFDDLDIPEQIHPNFAPPSAAPFQSFAPYHPQSSSYTEHLWRNRNPETLEKYDHVQKRYKTKQGYENYIRECISLDHVEDLEPELYYEDQMKTLLTSENVSQKEMEEYSRTFFKSAFENGSYCMRCSLRSLRSIFESGSFQNQHQTQTSHGMLNRNVRKNYEIQKLGAHQSTRPENLPKYGYWGPSNDCLEYDNGMLNHYGSVIVKFKPENVKKRCTFTLGDSLDEKTNCLPSKTIDPNLFAVSYRYKKSLIEQAMNFHATPGESADLYEAIPYKNHMFLTYPEIQYHGELTPDDIESIYIKLSFDPKTVTSFIPPLPDDMDALFTKISRELGIPLSHADKTLFSTYFAFQELLTNAKSRNIPVKLLDMQGRYAANQQNKKFHTRAFSELSEDLIKNVIVAKSSPNQDRETLHRGYLTIRKWELRIKAQQLGVPAALVEKKLQRLPPNITSEAFEQQYNEIWECIMREKEFLKFMQPTNKTQAREELPKLKHEALSIHSLDALLLADHKPVKEIAHQATPMTQTLAHLPNYVQHLFVHLPVKIQNYYFLDSTNETAKKHRDLDIFINEMQRRYVKENWSVTTCTTRGDKLIKQILLDLIEKGYDVQHFWPTSSKTPPTKERFDSYHAITAMMPKHTPTTPAKSQTLLKKILDWRTSKIYAAVSKLRELPTGNPDHFSSSPFGLPSRFSLATGRFFHNVNYFSKDKKQDERRNDFITKVMTPYLQGKDERRIATKDNFSNILKQMYQDPFLESQYRDALHTYLILERRFEGELNNTADLPRKKELETFLWTRIMTLAGFTPNTFYDAPSNNTYGLKGIYEDILSETDGEQAKFLQAKAIATLNNYEGADALLAAAHVDYNALLKAKDKTQFRAILLANL